MAKESGLAVTTLSVDDSTDTLQAIINNITSFGMSIPSNVQDVTGLDKSAMERLLLLADAQFTPTGVFDDAANMSHAVFKNYRTLNAGEVGRSVSLVHSGQTLNNEILFTDYNLARGADGSLIWTAPGGLAGGVVPSWS